MDELKNSLLKFEKWLLNIPTILQYSFKPGHICYFTKLINGFVGII